MGNNDLISEVLDFEMVHWASDDLFIAHKANTVTYRKNGITEKIKMPTDALGWKKIFMPFRKLRRLLRTDKAMIAPTKKGFVLIRFGRIYLYNVASRVWQRTDTVLNCRNPMYNGLIVIEGTLYLAEYGNRNGIGKRILCSQNSGADWTCVYQFKPEEIRHIHCLAWDRYDEKIWIFTGDTDSECKVLKTDRSFQNVEYVGGGDQRWRSCHALFSEQFVTWMMDSPLEEVHQITYDRLSGKITAGQVFPGPVWFAREYSDGTAFSATAQEIGPSHKDNLLHLYQSCNLMNWEEIAAFHYDGWPKRYFRFGTMTLVKGTGKMISCEGVKHLDGKTLILK